MEVGCLQRTTAAAAFFLCVLPGGLRDERGKVVGNGDGAFFHGFHGTKVCKRLGERVNDPRRTGYSKAELPAAGGVFTPSGTGGGRTGDSLRRTYSVRNSSSKRGIGRCGARQGTSGFFIFFLPCCWACLSSIYAKRGWEGGREEGVYKGGQLLPHRPYLGVSKMGLVFRIVHDAHGGVNSALMTFLSL